MSLTVLPESGIDISGFGGIRERVLVMDPRLFGHRVREECWPGLAGCVYLANAWFLAGGSTGLHQHQRVDIVSVITQGRILHRGSLGHDEWLSAGQVQIQRSGGSGFSHNEINPSDDLPAMVQIWCLPDADADAGDAEYRVISPGHGICRVYQSRTTAVATMRLAPGEGAELPAPALGYITRGEASLAARHLQRGDLFRVEGAERLITATAALELVLITLA